MKVGDVVRLTRPGWFHVNPRKLFTVHEIVQPSNKCGSGIGVRVVPPIFECDPLDKEYDSTHFEVVDPAQLVERPLGTRSMRGPHSWEWEVWEFFQVPGYGFSFRVKVFTEKMPPEVLADWNSMPSPPGFENAQRYLFPMFSSLKRAVRYTRLPDEEHCLFEEIDAFNAPGECAKGPLERIAAEQLRLEEGSVTLPW